MKFFKEGKSLATCGIHWLLFLTNIWKELYKLTWTCREHPECNAWRWCEHYGNCKDEYGGIIPLYGCQLRREFPWPSGLPSNRTSELRRLLPKQSTSGFVQRKLQVHLVANTVPWLTYPFIASLSANDCKFGLTSVFFHFAICIWKPQDRQKYCNCWAFGSTV